MQILVVSLFLIDLYTEITYISDTEAALLKKLFLMSLLIFIPISPAIALEGKGITIIYTNDVIGEIEPCG